MRVYNGGELKREALEITGQLITEYVKKLRLLVEGIRSY